MARSVITIDDLSIEEMEHIFDVADGFLEVMHDPARPHRIQGRDKLADRHILATLFFEPSTRTRFSFESAMQRLGGQVISSPNSAATSSAKGESIADTVRVLENYADLIVIRHPSEGAARVAANYASVPVINAGDGSHEHPTQTLCDLYTLRKEKKSLKDLNVVLYGDLKHGRTVHSLVYALARLGARIIPMPAKGLELPGHVIRRLQRDYGCTPFKREEKTNGRGLPIDVIYVTQEKPHQRRLYPEAELAEFNASLKKLLAKIENIDVFYVTRLQKERLGEQRDTETYPPIDNAFLKGKKYKDSRVLHPLPRVAELGYDLDNDPRGVYFKQAAYGVPVRMALIAWLLDLKPSSKSTAPVRTFPQYGHKDGIRCSNQACVTKLQSEQEHLTPAFWIVEQDGPVILRCMFCEYEWAARCAGRVSKRRYFTDTSKWKDMDPGDLVLFAEERDATNAHFTPYKETAASKCLTPTPS